MKSVWATCSGVPMDTSMFSTGAIDREEWWVYLLFNGGCAPTRPLPRLGRPIYPAHPL